MHPNTNYMCWIEDSSKKKTEKQLIHFHRFFYSFRGLWITNFEIFSKLGEKNKMPLNSRTNGSKDILYVLDKRFFK